MGYLGVLLNITNARLRYIGLGSVGNQDRDDAASQGRPRSELRTTVYMLIKILTCVFKLPRPLTEVRLYRGGVSGTDGRVVRLKLRWRHLVRAVGEGRKHEIDNRYTTER